MASSTSSRSADLYAGSSAAGVSTAFSVVSLMLASPGSGAGVLEGHPAHQRALDSRRVLRHAGERDGVLELVLELLGHRGVALALHQGHEVLARLQRLRHRL